jgi:hypothetical protein
VDLRVWTAKRPTYTCTDTGAERYYPGGLDRALLLQARAANVKVVEKEAHAIRYLTNPELEVLPADDKQRVEQRLSRNHRSGVRIPEAAPVCEPVG